MSPDPSRWRVLTCALTHIPPGTLAPLSYNRHWWSTHLYKIRGNDLLTIYYVQTEVISNVQRIGTCLPVDREVFSYNDPVHTNVTEDEHNIKTVQCGVCVRFINRLVSMAYVTLLSSGPTAILRPVQPWLLREKKWRCLQVHYGIASPSGSS